MEAEDESTDDAAVAKLRSFLGKKRMHRDLTLESERLTDEFKAEEEEVASMQAHCDNANQQLEEGKERLHKKARELQENKEKLIQLNAPALNDELDQFVNVIKFQC